MISSFINWNILLESRLDTLLSYLGLFLFVFYMYEKTMVICCGAGAPQENAETTEDLKDAGPVEEAILVEEALPAAEKEKLGDEGAA